jgi:hypothetical protein
MNERLAQLAEQAGYNIKELDIQEQMIAEKFAELIVKECIRVPYDMWDKAELNADIAVKIDYRIKDHFGVEE